MILFYSSNAPEWWPYQVVSLSSSRRSLKRRNYYYIIVDNGMFTFLQQGYRPKIDTWINSLRRLVYDIERKLRPVELYIILPDWFKDPEFTLMVAESYSNKLCKDYKCMAVSHYNYHLDMSKVIHRLLEVDYISKIAVPCKLYCSRRISSRRIIRYECQKALVEIAYSVIGKKEKIHALGLGLKKDLIAGLKEKIDSFDTTSWTRPIKSRPVRYSAKTASEREEYFIETLKHLSDHILIPSSIPSDIFAYILQGG